MRFNLFIKPFFYFLVFFVVAFLHSCNSDKIEYIPYRYVDFTVDLNIKNDLAVPGFSELYPFEGFGGVIVFCEFYDFTYPELSIFKAFDAACTHEVTDSCSIINYGNSFYGECPCCQSKFEFTSGTPVDGEAFYPLKNYKVSYINNRLYIRN